MLIYRWRYFFPNNCDESEGSARTDELRSALAALGRALLQPDIELLRLNMDTLDALNTKCKLYHKVRVSLVIVIFLNTCRYSEPISLHITHLLFCHSTQQDITEC